MIGKGLDAFVRAGQAAEVWAGITSVFRDYGYRRLRHRARLKFLVADWGPERFREVLEKEYLGYALPDGGPPPPPPEGPRGPIRVGQQPGGPRHRRFPPRVRRMSGGS